MKRLIYLRLLAVLCVVGASMSLSSKSDAAIFPPCLGGCYTVRAFCIGNCPDTSIGAACRARCMDRYYDCTIRCVTGQAYWAEISEEMMEEFPNEWQC